MDRERTMEDGRIIHGDSLEELKKLEENSVDLVVTDPPYGIGFMGKEWDTFKSDYIEKKKETGQYFASKADVAGKYSFDKESSKKFGKFIENIFTEVLRVTKPGGFLFMTMTPRQDSLARVIVGLEDAGWKVSFTSMYWTFASGFPKASNVGKRTGKEELKGAYGGFQPKPAVEVIIVAMKPLSEKTYVDQALKNGKGITWLDSCRIPTSEEVTNHSRSAESAISKGKYGDSKAQETHQTEGQKLGRFPANLLVSDDVLNDGVERKSIQHKINNNDPQGNSLYQGGFKPNDTNPTYSDSGSYSRYFSLDSWANTLPFLITPKPSKSEKNRGLDDLPDKEIKHKQFNSEHRDDPRTEGGYENPPQLPSKNNHPTVKPLKLMSYLITLGSREGDLILDPFAGSGTTLVATKELKRNYIGIEREKEYVDIAEARLKTIQEPLWKL